MLTKADITRLRSLREKKHREALGLFVIEGEKVIAELLAEKFPLLEIYITPESRIPGIPHSAMLSCPPAARAPGQDKPSASLQAIASGDAICALSRFVRIPHSEMARISHLPTPSAALAVGRIERPPLDPAELARGLTLALDDVQNPGNVGTLLRIADWFAFERVVCSPGCADIFSQKVINSSMGSFRRVRAFTHPLADALSRARAADASVPVLGCDLGGQDIHTLAPHPDAIVVIGSEGRGLSPAVRARVTQFITIPRHGRAESLNAAIAAAIVADNLRRAQNTQNKPPASRRDF